MGSLASVMRFLRSCFMEHVKVSSLLRFKSNEASEKKKVVKATDSDRKDDHDGVLSSDGKVTEKVEKGRQNKRERSRACKCINSCCWLIGCMCTTSWLLLVFLAYIIHASMPAVQLPEFPGARMKREGVVANHPVVLVPGIITGGLELWEGKPCAAPLFRKRLWGGWGSGCTNIFRSPLCWTEHLSLDYETGLDPPGIRVRPVPGLIAADYFAPGYFVWAVLIENLAQIGYEDRNMYMAAYDWRLSFQNTEVRDRSLSRLKAQIEIMYATNGDKKVVVLPHSMGAVYFLHFLKWVEAPAPMGGGGGPGWCAKHIKAVVNIGPTYLGVPKAFSTLLSAEGKDISIIRAMASGLLESELFGLQTVEHVMRVSRTWDSIISLLPKGGEAVWGNLDWSPEEGYECGLEKKRHFQADSRENNSKSSEENSSLQVNHPKKYGRVISFGQEASQVHSSKLPTFSKDFMHTSISTNLNASHGKFRTEFDEMSHESFDKIVEKKVYTTTDLVDLLRYVAPKMMRRAEAHYSHGIAENLEDPKYNHHKYWSNPLETKLPDAPDMEIYCLYGVGLPTERSYVYKMSPSSDKRKGIPFRIDNSVDGSDDCLKAGIYFVDGDETVPVLSSGFMCAKGWKGKTRFNPSGSATYIREYRHKPPASLFEGRGLESSGHVDIMGNLAMIEDVLRVAAGATGPEMGGDQIHSDLLKMCDRVNVPL
ncbi:putative phospholipid:diacylglycerol acyltransferase 2 isoform X2 [Daucus carota subsp. sativus]|nr:PREDICTED: putative phospholipid:diacylglycerol acyltransferase 2 isoform X2 [Daucus carota subsp. sativus]XP_017231841.1 PREDICTED: putative phospholipid:diacylglycerol acyltransferase 2 isoform X2 [Daucus carota subsp. sativus]XP_017231842.1 PREDICTED: putative phospholipid:diacylglycerol acyltransferase 2 isoform X2 [Daucus carota subsp. sativus]